jgi:bis(5'-nucleosyl)-tetraphosphatase (symmetrical)
LRALVDSFGFDPSRDRLWFVGDLVNRGPDSLACLRYVKSLGETAVTVLGNHDLHLVCVAAGVVASGRRDTLGEVLAAPDRDELLDWLRSRPLMHVEGDVAMVHAGLLPQWSIARARALAAEVEEALRSPGHGELLRRMYGDEPASWDEGLRGVERLRVVINSMTRLRVVDANGAMVLGFKGEPGEAHDRATPWFDVASRASRGHAIVCGHWSALGLVVRPDLMSLDSGCVWGRSLTAIRLEDRRIFSVPCPGSRGRGE